MTNCFDEEHQGREKLDRLNQSTLDVVKKFRADLSLSKASRNDIPALKQKHPYFGFLPCRAGTIDFLMFHGHDDVVAWEYLWLGPDAYEAEIVAVWLEWCKTPSVVLDIGAYTGLMATLACLSHPQTVVHVFEPMERVIARAKINFAVNQVQERIHLHPKAVSDTASEISINLYRDENFLGTGTSVYDKGFPAVTTKQIETVAIDDYLPNVIPTIIKMDIEGHEKSALKGMRLLLENYRPKLILEMWEHTRSEILKDLGAIGYECTPFETTEKRVMNFQCVPTT